MAIKDATLNALSNMDDEKAEHAARAIVKHLGGFESGIEHISLPTGVELAYVNTDDTYDATLLRVDGEWIYSSWGDVYEAAENEHTEDGNTRCCYCGEWTEGDVACHDENGDATDA